MSSLFQFLYGYSINEAYFIHGVVFLFDNQVILSEMGVPKVDLWERLMKNGDVYVLGPVVLISVKSLKHTLLHCM